jgi:hypothetical protein
VPGEEKAGKKILKKRKGPVKYMRSSKRAKNLQRMRFFFSRSTG